MINFTDLFLTHVIHIKNQGSFVDHVLFWKPKIYSINDLIVTKKISPPQGMTQGLSPLYRCTDENDKCTDENDIFLSNQLCF